MRRFCKSVVLFVIVTLAANTAHCDITYDATSSFSSAQNPNGVWSYGWQLESSLGSPGINVFDTNGNFSGVFADFNAWTDSTLSTGPFVGKYQSATDSGLQDGTIFKANQFAMHSGNALVGGVAAAVVRFTAPVAGNYHIDQAIFEYRSDIPGNAVYIYRNGTNIFQQTLGAMGSQASFAPTTLSLLAGDHLDFVVGSRTGATNSTTTQLNAMLTQSSVPEPSATTLMAVIGSCVGLMRFRRRTTVC